MKFLVLLAFGLLSFSPLRADVRLEILPGSTLKKVQVQITNTGDQPFALWQTSNSWGWSNFSFRTKYQGQDELFVRTIGAFSRNVPSSFTIKPGKRTVLNFDLTDYSWVSSEDPAVLPRDLDLRVDLAIHESEDARKYGISVGKWRGVWGKCANPDGFK